jgi:AraC family transcriptional regulator, transcriptional activator of pobA
MLEWLRQSRWWYFSDMPRRAATGQIPHFALFGEAPTVDPGPALHVEPIRRRSGPRGWEISDHAHDSLLQAVVVRQGGVELRADGRSTLQRGPVIVCVPPGVVHAFRFDPAVDGDVVSIGDAAAGASDREPLATLTTPLLLAPLILQPGMRALRQLAPLLTLARTETDAARPGRALMLGWLARCMLLWLSRLREDGRDVLAPVGLATSRLLRFRQLVERHFREQRNIGFYAKSLGLTERSLSRLCQDAEGLSPGRLIDARIALEARRRLLYSHEPVSSIAYDLGFEDPAYFSRFVRRHAGTAPSQLRRGGRAAPDPLRS